MLRLEGDELEDAWQDMLTCHRLARLVGQDPVGLDAFVALTIEERAYATDQALLQHAQLTATQIALIRNDQKLLPPMPKVADMFDVVERFLYLNIVSVLSKEGFASLDGYEEMLGGKVYADVVKSLVRYSADTPIDWDIILRMGNSWFDRIAHAYRKPTRAEQRESLRKLDEDLRKLKKTAADAKSLDKAMLDNPRKALSERLSRVLLSIFFPDVMIHAQFEDRVIVRFELNELGFALAAYRADRGAYPAKLADLTPKYIVKAPEDVFNDSELHYRLEGKGYLLYSVGVNGKDDGAKSYEDRKKDEDWDDLIIRVPAPEQN